jgi:hypothetical protein
MAALMLALVAYAADMIGPMTYKGTHNASGATQTRLDKEATSDPSTCTKGETYWNSSTLKRRRCTATNTWSDETPTVATQLQAQEGTNNTAMMTPLSVAQAILAQVTAIADPTDKAGYIATSDGTLAKYSHPADFLRANHYWLEEFLPSPGGASWGNVRRMWQYSASGGATWVNDTTIASFDAPGIITITTTATTNGDVALSSGSGSSPTGYFPSIHQIQIAPYIYREFGFITDTTQVTRWQGAFMTAAYPNGSFQEGVGMVATTNSVTCNSGDTSPTTGNFILYSQDSSGNKWCEDTGVTPGNSTKYKFRMIAEGGVITLGIGVGSAAFTDYEVGAYEPSASLAKHFVIKNLGTTSAKMHCDYMIGFDQGRAR